MTGLLVSVRDAAEAAAALTAGVDLIDVKEPRRGSLGSADGPTIRQVVDTVAHNSVTPGNTAAQSVPISVALGELADLRPQVAAGCCRGVQFAKLGLAGCATLVDWRERWTQALSALPANVGRVAVIYADWPAARAPLPADVLGTAVKLQCAAALVDTFDKRGGGLLDHWSLDQIEQFIGSAQSLGMLAVVGGSLTLSNLERVLPLAPDFVAVRGAACERSRSGAISPDRLAELVCLVRHFQQGRAKDLPAAHTACDAPDGSAAIGKSRA